MVRSATAPKVNLHWGRESQPIPVDMQKWFEFNFWMAEELLDLVAQHELQQSRSQTGQIQRGDRLGCRENRKAN